MSPEAKVKPKSSETKRKAAGEGDELHPDACLVCRELKSKEDKQNKMIGKLTFDLSPILLPPCS